MGCFTNCLTTLDSGTIRSSAVTALRRQLAVVDNVQLRFVVSPLANDEIPQLFAALFGYVALHGASCPISFFESHSTGYE